MLAMVVGRKESSLIFTIIVVVIIGVMVWFLLLDFDFVRMYSVINRQTFDSIFAPSKMHLSRNQSVVHAALGFT